MAKFGERLLVRSAEAADCLGVGATTFHQLVATGQIKAVRIGRAVRIPVVELRRYVEQLSSSVE